MKNLSTILRLQRMFASVILLTIGFTFSESVSQVLFFEDFENGSGQWPIPGSMVITTASAYAGSFSQTFTGLASGGDTRAFIFSVTPGQTYYLHVAYMTLGGGGYIGIDRFNVSMQFVGEQWMIGDGGWPPTLGRFDYNVFNTDPANLGIWKVYTQAYTIPGHVNFIRIKTEDWDGGLPNDPLNYGVFFDNIEWSTDPTPSFLPSVCVNPPSGLVSWWPGEDNANDIQSNNHGTLQNGATFAAGKVGQAFSFDGMDDATSIADNASLRISNFTLDAWINTADATLIQPIIAKVQTSENWISYMLRIQDGGKLALIVENRAENRYAHWRTLSTLSSNRWYHVAGTWQNLNGDNTDAKIYIDGVEQAIEMSLNNGYGSTFLIGYTSEPLYLVVRFQINIAMDYKQF